jgi:hypothetical protein
MKLAGLLLIFFLAASVTALSQPAADPRFPIFFNSGIGFTHAHDQKINSWLKKYGYPQEPSVPSSYNFELGAMPVNSPLLYTIRLTTINTLQNLSSYSFSLGLYRALVNRRKLMVFAGGSLGYHDDIINLDGSVPESYHNPSVPADSQLALRRSGLFLSPGARLAWYPIGIRNVQLGVTTALGYDLDFNSRWRLGYYSDDHGKYEHFKEIDKPADQQRVTEHGFSFGAGLSLRVNLH